MGIMTFRNTMLANLFKKPVTTKYPAEPIDYPEGSRGHIEIEIEKCISCMLCAKNCPSGAITVDRKEGSWEINRMDCIQCGYCTMKCPKKCLHIVPGYTAPDGVKQVDRFVRPPETMKPAAKPPAAPKPAEEKKPEAVPKPAEEKKPEAVPKPAEEKKPEAAAKPTEEKKPEAAQKAADAVKTEETKQN